MTDEIYVKVDELYKQVKKMYESNDIVAKLTIDDESNIENHPILLHLSAHDKDIYWSEYDSIFGLLDYNNEDE